jgi:hypothetical protein
MLRQKVGPGESCGALWLNCGTTRQFNALSKKPRLTKKEGWGKLGRNAGVTCESISTFAAISCGLRLLRITLTN